MNIYGEKVVLRALEEQDNGMLLRLINDPQTERMIGGSSRPISQEEQKKWFDGLQIKNDVMRCAVATIDDVSKAVGTIILTNIDTKNAVAQVHIKMDADGGRSKGYGTDAIQAITEYAFSEMRLNCIYAEVLQSNMASCTLFRKCGFHCDGVLRSRVYKNAGFQDVCVYSLLRDDDATVQ